MEPKHSYGSIENTLLWKVIEQVLGELIDNQDIELVARKENVIGYICKKLDDNFELPEE